MGSALRLCPVGSGGFRGALAHDWRMKRAAGERIDLRQKKSLDEGSEMTPASADLGCEGSAMFVQWEKTSCAAALAVSFASSQQPAIHMYGRFPSIRSSKNAFFP